jgi:hypothetical protein
MTRTRARDTVGLTSRASRDETPVSSALLSRATDGAAAVFPPSLVAAASDNGPARASVAPAAGATSHSSQTPASIQSP